jgi:AmiR/NasT family two-component response regulator
MIINSDTRVLVVDDTPKHLREIANFAKRIGYKVVDTATNNIDALNKLKYQTYGLIISDNAGLLEITVGTPSILTIIESEYKLNIINSSVHKYIVTPFSEETLKHTIEEL